jgi:aspartyl-tRNA(Asn)/glutamyl-tRNA(Gln) amidotransferase subunit C
MSFSHDDVSRLARLARIDLDDTAIDDVRAKLDAIFALIDALSSIDTTGIEPMAHAQDVMLPLRDDVVSAEDRRELYQAQAPAVADGLYLVPKVIE